MRVFAASAGLGKRCSLMGLCVHALAGASSRGRLWDWADVPAMAQLLLVLGKPLAAEMEAFLDVPCAGGILDIAASRGHCRQGILLIHIPFSPFSFLLWNSLGSVILPSQGSEFHTGLLSVGGDPTLIPP